MMLMATTEQVLQHLQFAASVTTLLFTFSSFLVNHGYSTIEKTFGPRISAVIVGSIGCIVAYYVTQAIIVFQGRHELVQIQDRLMLLVILSLAWSSLLTRTHSWLPELTGLCVISLVSGIPVLVLDTIYRTRYATYQALLVAESLPLVHGGAVLVYCLIVYLRLRRTRAKLAEETRSSLSNSDSSIASERYRDHCSNLDSESDSDTDISDDEDEEDLDTRIGELRKSGHWIDYLSDFKVFLPFLIPRKNIKVQLCFLVCVLCLITDRVLNVLVPTQLGSIANKLFTQELALSDLGIYFALNILHGQSGLEMLMSLAKIPIQQFSYRQLTNAAFSHVMDLTMEFHSERDSAEVMKSIEQGAALTNVLETSFLEIAPAVIDLFVAFVLLYLKFNSLAAMCMLIATLTFLSLEVAASRWNIDNRRQLTKAERGEARVMHQAIQGWLTVSSFNMFAYEKCRFAEAVDKHLTAKRKWSCRDVYLTGLMEACFPASFVVLACVVAHEVSQGRASPGDFVFLIQYWDYLIWPIKYLTKDYRWLIADLIDAERLLDLLTTKPTVSDKCDAFDLGPVQGYVEFEDACFSYNNKREPAVRDINISAAPGAIIALVGTTGAGKSSLVKLLLRHYDVTSGRVKIDGHDIRDVTKGSLRNSIGIVPQNPILFNASIMDNIRYAKLDASDEEVHRACQAAAIHDKILSFAQGYQTKVGEQGVKLSGGEVQRLAIARAIVKSPPILILDEATSAVDTETEAKIQEALKHLIKDRTTFVIAHRLSTVVNADRIFVLDNGSIAESGTHRELLEKQGRYYNLWNTQLHENEDPMMINLESTD
ncbi:hypothetical protein BDV27DRAFT_132306 [Aspergillus caelatus]|uniref:Uncharacterized protein n=1 Tax=Aspergillus caelatus TaxID=61420 RepID=A0A5N6ZXF2_9EURO|nr:uncharacterized protein BDV27DRAFT_132306 [Aspergillus caelatus]KAE8361953.1 hypothetical protein BDV27DRAFT_132306 [Aspergillus caelatus]